MSKGRVLTVYILVNLVIAILGIALFVGVNGKHAEFFKAVGTSVAAAGFTGLLLTTYVELQDRRDGRIQAAADLTEKLGLVQVYERRPDMALGNPPFRDASEIDILEISGRTISGRHDDPDAWKRSCSKAGIRVILLHPAFPSSSESFALRRDAEEARPAGEIGHEVQRFFNLYGGKQSWESGRHAGSYELRLTKTMPAISYVRADGHAYMAPYLARLAGPDVPHIEIGEGPMLRALKQNFERLWREADLADEVLSTLSSCRSTLPNSRQAAPAPRRWWWVHRR